VRLEGLGKLKKKIHLIRTRTQYLPACSTVPQPTTVNRFTFTLRDAVCKRRLATVWRRTFGLIPPGRYPSAAGNSGVSSDKPRIHRKKSVQKTLHKLSHVRTFVRSDTLATAHQTHSDNNRRHLERDCHRSTTTQL
jgi:hypothetical protein